MQPIAACVAPDTPVLATGSHLKNALAWCVDGRVILGQHVGDLENTLSIDAMQAAAADLQAFFHVQPGHVACDLHPDYASSRFAREQGLPVTRVQHHLAHALACMVEHGLDGPILAVIWDGAGLGPDGSVWGGEFLRVHRGGWQRVAHLRRFRLAGGDAAARDAGRALHGLLHGSGRIEDAHLERGLNAPWCSSVGRLFDAFAALAGLCGRQSYEGQAAARLEAAIRPGDEAYPLPLHEGVLDWAPMLEAATADEPGAIATKFHNALIEGIVAVARAAGNATVALSGGCFHNRYLTERALQRLRSAGFTPVIARRVPPNDGGIALGQLAAVTGAG